jgi:hypothetical protein
MPGQGQVFEMLEETRAQPRRESKTHERGDEQLEPGHSRADGAEAEEQPQ